LKVDERALIRRSAGRASRYRGRYTPQPDAPGQPAPTRVTSHRQLETLCIKAVLSDPNLLLFIDRAFRGYELACVHAEDFSHADHRELFKLVRDALDQEVEDPLTYIHSRMPQDLVDDTDQDSADETYPDWHLQPDDPKLESLLRMFIRLRRIRVDEGLDQLVFLQSQAGEESGDITVDIKTVVMEYVRARAKIDQALRTSFSIQKHKS